MQPPVVRTRKRDETAGREGGREGGLEGGREEGRKGWLEGGRGKKPWKKM
jgi:hypothetical protein